MGPVSRYIVNFGMHGTYIPDRIHPPLSDDWRCTGLPQWPSELPSTFPLPPLCTLLFHQHALCRKTSPLQRREAPDLRKFPTSTVARLSRVSCWGSTDLQGDPSPDGRTCHRNTCRCEDTAAGRLPCSHRRVASSAASAATSRGRPCASSWTSGAWLTTGSGRCT